ncbi:MAG: putative bifunctional diguanylate cyclase/phosphodiesterase [Solirubrobacteraceae bacterium]
MSRRPTESHWTVRPLARMPMGAVVAAYFGLYLLTAWWGKQLINGPATPWYPPPGLTIVLVVAFGVRWAPLAVLAEAVSSIVIFNVDESFTVVQLVVNALLIGVGLSVGPAWMRARLGNGAALRDPKTLWLFMFTCVILGPGLTAFGGIGVREWADAMGGQSYWDGVRTWFLGDALGVVTIAPLVLVMMLKGPIVRRLISRRFLIELGVLVVVAVLMLVIEGSGTRLAYLTLIPLLAVSYRHGLVGAAFAASATNIIFVTVGHLTLSGAQFEKVQGLIVTMSLGALVTGSIAAHDRRAQRKAAAAAVNDHVSGLASRSRLLSWLNEAMEDPAHRHSTALMIVDVDRFNAVNNVWGQIVGDRLLRMIADRIAEVVRYDGKCARFGSDEFGVLFSGNRKRALELADQMLEALAVPFVVDGNELSIQVHIGIAPAEDLEQPGDVVRGACLALQRAAGDEQRVVVLDAALWEQSTHDQVLEADLPAAMENGQLYLAYQPIVWLKRPEHESYEALLRWNHPTFGGVPPPVVIELAQRSGMLGQLTEWVISTASRQIATWQAEGRDVVVEVNITSVDLFSPGFTEKAAELVAAAGIRPSSLVLELTEESAIADLDHAITVLTALGEIGFELAIDDFGTGYASLTYLESLPVHILKLDRAFAARLTGSSRTAAIVQAIVPLAQALGLSVVAEGIEHQEQLEILEELDCDAIQGYLLGMPRAATEYDLGPVATALATVGAAEASD